MDKNESKIVRANSLEALFKISKKDFDIIVREIKKESVESLNARIKKINYELEEI